MRFKDRIKGLDPEVFELAAEGLATGEYPSGACYAVTQAQYIKNKPDGFRGMGYTSPYHTLMEDMFKADSPYQGDGFYFGPPMKYGNTCEARESLKHRIQALLLLAEMIRYARR